MLFGHRFGALRDEVADRDQLSTGAPAAAAAWVGPTSPAPMTP